MGTKTLVATVVGSMLLSGLLIVGAVKMAHDSYMAGKAVCQVQK